MDIEKLKALIEKLLSQRQIAKELQCSQASVKHWLKKYKLKTINTRKFEHLGIPDDKKYCRTCDSVKAKTEFYKHGSRSNAPQSYCKQCSHKRITIKGKQIKMKMVEYKGGKCLDCKLSAGENNVCVFDFHHLDPKTKDVNYNTIRWKKWETITKELDKCVLVCANCHRLRHAAMNKIN